MLEAVASNRGKMERAFREMEREASEALRREGFGGDIAAAFHRAHLARYGYAQEANKVEIVSLRLRSAGLVEKLKRRRSRGRKGSVARPRRFARVHFAGGASRAAVYERGELGPGARLRTPCVVTEYSATTLVPAGARAFVDEHGNLVIKP
jgi:N-methylhydantoinase A